MTPFPVWLNCADGTTKRLWSGMGAGNGAFGVLMYPEIIEAWEKRYGITIESIATDRADNIIWRKP